jgi:hypothetical protein
MLNVTAGLDQLLAAVAALDEGEDLVVRFLSATWSGRSLQLTLTIGASDLSPAVWEVRCEDVLAYSLRSEIADGLELTDAHPSLWEFREQSASAFFLGAPGDATAAVGDLYEAHQKAVGTWIEFGRHLNGSFALSKLLAVGNGLLARGPLPLLSLYKQVLIPHGVQVSICSAYPAKIWDGAEWRIFSSDDNPKALLIGSSYVIGDEWLARRES